MSNSELVEKIQDVLLERHGAYVAFTVFNHHLSKEAGCDKEADIYGDDREQIINEMSLEQILSAQTTTISHYGHFTPNFQLKVVA